ncbi:gluconate 2-dehydrogenase subunit 3 family protein [Colwellia sp. D2M02]|uniref:gluconate 2-dehydrogenase subunit 3 family protein n=1 Tax=Colwellia sp. D2M02 TaxID=2841562 RepID=UPI001C07FAAB|nr:gluconate 2-dehydrogenase subunit 3 family protein [Colwellia sp. D2M02]MBU2894624.1 gluconate 2-dehydrogenase subunit 3 family protein [Colwellia sp. D2M02]
MTTLFSGKSFFDESYQTPEFIKNKNLTRRRLLKSAAGVGAASVFPAFSFNADVQKALSSLLNSDPWLTLNATLEHLLPESPTTNSNNTTAQDISAKQINATAYLYQIMTIQPTEQAEKDFILKGVGWLNGYAQSEKKQSFVELGFTEKEQLLKGINQSRAGQNWLNTLLGYIFEAMLTPAAYGGNPKGIGWQWLEHQGGFPLPEKGQRYFELPPRAKPQGHK